MSKWHQTTWKKSSYNTYETRMHSSRMRTVRSSSRLLGGVCQGGVSQHALGQTPPGGVPGGCLPRGCIAACTRTDTSLWTEWLTDRCKNITFPQLRFRTVINVGPSDTSVKTFCEKRKQLQNHKSRPSDQVSFVNNGVSLRKIRSVKNLLQNKFPTINGTCSRKLPWHNAM